MRCFSFNTNLTIIIQKPKTYFEKTCKSTMVKASNIHTPVLMSGISFLNTAVRTKNVIIPKLKPKTRPGHNSPLKYSTHNAVVLMKIYDIGILNVQAIINGWSFAHVLKN